MYWPVWVSFLYTVVHSLHLRRKGSFLPSSNFIVNFLWIIEQASQVTAGLQSRQNFIHHKLHQIYPHSTSSLTPLCTEARKHFDGVV